MKKYELQRRLASDLLKVGENRVSFNPNKLKEIGEAITREDVRALIHNNSIKAKKIKGTSRSRAKEHHEQRKKGRRKGEGKKKGKYKSRNPKKKEWMKKIRSQRKLLSLLLIKEVVNKSFYRKLYRLAKSGFFRNKSHLKLFIKKKKPVEKQVVKIKKKTKSSTRTKTSKKTKSSTKTKTSKKGGKGGKP